jgi:peptide/nickel transport system permease protein
VAGGLIVAIECLLALLAPVLAPYPPDAQVSRTMLPVGSPGHVFGTDDLGRDILSRLLHGAPISLLEGVVVVAIALVLAIPLGLLVVEVPRLDALVMRTVDALLAFPGILLALAVVAALGPSLVSVLIAVGISSAPPTVVLVRATALSVTRNDYVTAARGLGANRLRISARHVLPNIMAPILVSATFRVATAILVGTSLSFLGLGAQPPSPEWGALLSTGRDLLYVAPHIAALPGVAIFLTVLGFNLLGDGLRDVLDPRLRT